MGTGESGWLGTTRPVSQRIRSPRRCGPPRIDYASECGPTSADTVRHSGYDSTIENTTLSREMTIVDVRSTPVHYRIRFFTHEN